MAGVALLHLGSLLSSGVVVLEWAFAPDGVRVSPDERREEPPKAGTMRGANPPRICRSPLDSMRLYATYSTASRWSRGVVSLAGLGWCERVEMAIA